jgi:hypothetical protein
MVERLQILLKFLDRFDDEVQGRGLTQPAEDTKIKLRDFARGALPEKEQTEILVLLDKNPEWTAWLASEVKGLRRSS